MRVCKEGRERRKVGGWKEGGGTGREGGEKSREAGGRERRGGRRGKGGQGMGEMVRKVMITVAVNKKFTFRLHTMIVLR